MSFEALPRESSHNDRGAAGRACHPLGSEAGVWEPVGCDGRGASVLKRKCDRSGAAAVELAVCLPVVVLVIFAALEGANMLFLRQAVVQASYEATKHASRRDGTRAQAETLAREVLSARRINPIQVRFVTGDPSRTSPGADVTVSVSVNSNDRLLTGFGLFSGRSIEVQSTMQKE